MAEYLPDLVASDAQNQLGYSTAMMAAELFKRCGDELTRENLIDKATHISGFQLPLFLDGITIDVTPEDRQPWKGSQLARFDGSNWKLFGSIITVDN